ncbi:S1 RNA-binding domain-containing protein [Streptomyces sp. NPDC004667]|uniref:S1 RNA-binding domain-containing protein n=1 Tax=Streptomyces sp. NPDC004667 TaxID=3154285 RepID=UPI0033ABD8EC
MSEYSWPGENGRPVPGAAAAWPATVRDLPLGTRVTGEVIGRQPFGVFLAVDGHPDAVGLARIDRMPGCMELPPVGRRVTGEVAWHADHNHQVGIVLAEWAGHEDPLPRFRAGQVVVGRITKIASIGVFVRLGHCVEGLLPLTGPAASAEAFREGRELRVRIVTADRERNHIVLAEPAP